MPSLPDDLSELFAFDAGSGAVTGRESKRLEFKQDYEPADVSEYTKVLASFANTAGGTIVFGVSNKPKRIVGCTNMVDEADWVNALRGDFDPEIPISIKEYQIGGVTLYAVAVDEGLHKPVLCKKNRTKQVTDKKGNKKDILILQESAIYFRYAGQTKTIGYADLHNLLAERETSYLRKMMETLQVVQKVGLASAGVVDLSAPRSSIYMSRETAKGLNFIDKATVVEEKGAPAYAVMGNVEVKDVIHAPLDDADKNLPSEAAQKLLPTVRQAYGRDARISPSQVTQLLKHLKIDGDNIHCVLERKLRRKYVTRMGISAIEAFVRDEPEKAIRVFGSKASIARYDAEHQKPEAAAESPEPKRRGGKRGEPIIVSDEVMIEPAIPDLIIGDFPPPVKENGDAGT
ncbi:MULTISPECIES: ATP-binding protein [unclassified Bradyrhizobium]|uniref:AlbA family DNA-binding domain-containing protein n=1 Tax=unclassified Bradyrhizobium TaxID=2631580 RepID=UPI0029165D7D|nr:MULTISPECIES: ATP-binding protein [unclassified Bradyrhizobium]